MLRVLVTGAAGFIGKHFVRMLASKRPGWVVTNVDLLSYAGNLAGLPTECPNYHFIHADIRDERTIAEAVRGQEAIVNFAAETHVDRSILSAGEFVSTNVLGTQVLLDVARRFHVNTFIQVSTDEVYGTLGPKDPAFREATPVGPRSPYSASKAAADLLGLSYYETFGMDVRITRCSNNYGPFQYPEKLIPLCIVNALHGLPIPLYGDGRQRRDWIHVEDHCRAILAVLEGGRPGEVYNVGAEEEVDNLSVVRAVLGEMSAPESLIRFVNDRPGHDRRYAMDARKIRGELAWEPRYRFDQGVRQTVAWYRANEAWWRPLLDEDYRAYYQTQYGAR